LSGGHASAKAEPARRGWIEDLARHHLGSKPKHLVEQGGGLTNAVWRMRVAHADYIVRTHADAAKVDDYRKEQWAMDAARAVGVPTPQVLEVGLGDGGRPFMIVEHVDGIEGRQAKNQCGVLEELGGLAARLNAVRTHGFGRSFDWSSNRLSRHDTWSAWLAEGFGVERRIDSLRRHKVVDAAQVASLRAIGRTMTTWNKRPALQHGDLRLKNTLVDADSGRIVAVIDWENAISSPPPYSDLSIALHDVGVDEKEAFLAGYGLDGRAYRAAVPYLRLFNILRYADVVEAAERDGDHPALRRYRLRLDGAVDLYRC